MGIFTNKRNMEKSNKINDFLAKWNPIGVPEEIAKDEYINYIDIIKSNVHTKDELRKCLIWLLEERMGLDVSSPESISDIEKACDELMKR